MRQPMLHEKEITEGTGIRFNRIQHHRLGGTGQTEHSFGGWFSGKLVQSFHQLKHENAGNYSDRDADRQDNRIKNDLLPRPAWRGYKSSLRDPISYLIGNRDGLD